MPFTIKWANVHSALVGDPPSFPKYATQILNLANQDAQGTRPSVVGQMSDLIEQSASKSHSEWAAWYQSRHPHAISEATRRIVQMLQNFREVILHIDEAMVERWVTDLVISKTFTGFRFQGAILEELAKRRGTSLRPATPADEARGIDGYVGGKPVSVKPDTYRNMPAPNEGIAVPIVFYEKTRTGVVVDDSAF